MHTQHNKNIALSLGILPIETNERNETNERKYYRDKVFIKTVKHAMSVFLFVSGSSSTWGRFKQKFKQKTREIAREVGLLAQNHRSDFKLSS